MNENAFVSAVRALIYIPKRIIYYLIAGTGSVIYLIAVFTAALVVRERDRRKDRKPRLVWGPEPIINNANWSAAMAEGGWQTECYTDGFASSINRRDDYGALLQERYPSLLFIRWPVPRMLAFIESLFKYDIFFISFRGWFLGPTIFWRLEAPLLKLARKHIVVIPFGADVYVYRRVRSTPLAHGLMMSIPEMARKQRSIAAKVDYWAEHADVVIPNFMGFDGIGRWDVLIFSPFCINLERWKSSVRRNDHDGRSGPVVITHSPNFRGFKGTEFLVDAVGRLQAEGLQVELRLLERVPNSEVQRTLHEEADILVEQLIATGHAISALEGMSSSLPVVCNLEDQSYVLPFRRWSFFGESPLVSASPENITDVLRELVTRPELRRTLGSAGRRYVEKYYGYDSARHMFGAVIDRLMGKPVDLLNLFNPRTGAYTNRTPKIQPPLIDNRIVRSQDE